MLLKLTRFITFIKKLNDCIRTPIVMLIPIVFLFITYKCVQVVLYLVYIGLLIAIKCYVLIWLSAKTVAIALVSFMLGYIMYKYAMNSNVDYHRLN
jgi:hypothetical protein